MRLSQALAFGLKPFVRANRLATAGLLMMAGFTLAACGGGLDLGVGDWFDGKGKNTGVSTEEVAALAQGGAKIALLLPLTANGGAADIAKALKEAGELAVFEAGQAGIILTTKDTKGTPAGAQAAAQAAVNEGAELIIGPLFSSSVKAVAPVVQAANVPVIAFSTDRNVAAEGIYLLSFLPDQEVARVVDHAIASGRRNFAALVPKSPYGAVIERALVAEAKRKGGKVVAVERYARNEQSIQAPAKKIAQSVLDQNRNVQALLIGEGGNLLRSIGSVLQQEGVSNSTVKFTCQEDCPVRSRPEPQCPGAPDRRRRQPVAQHRVGAPAGGRLELDRQVHRHGSLGRSGGQLHSGRAWWLVCRAAALGQIAVLSAVQERLWARAAAHRQPVL